MWGVLLAQEGGVVAGLSARQSGWGGFNVVSCVVCVCARASARSKNGSKEDREGARKTRASKL